MVLPKLIEKIENSKDYIAFKCVPGITSFEDNKKTRKLVDYFRKNGWNIRPAVVIESNAWGEKEKYYVTNYNEVEAAGILGIPYSFEVYKFENIEEDTKENVYDFINSWNR